MDFDIFQTALLVIAFIASLAYGVVYTVRPIGFVRSLTKTLAVSALAVAALVSGSSLLLVCALALGSVGDYFLSREGDRAFLCGLVAFAVAHLLYVFVLVDLGGFASFADPLAIGLFGLATGMAVILFLKAGDLKYPVVVYVGIIATMGLAALGLPDARSMTLFAAVFFIVSDTVLAFELFLLPKSAAARRATPYVIWGTYFAAQFLFFWDLGGVAVG